MSQEKTYHSWMLQAGFVVFVIAVVALGIGAYFYGPELLELARTSVSVVEDRPDVQARLQQEYSGEEFTVQDRLTDGERSLSVGLVNSKHAGLDFEPQRAVAHEVAKFAFLAHPQASELIEVSVHFSTVSSTGPVRWEENSEPHRFAREELQD